MRLVPRFSLRFLFLAVTVFVIVFGVGGKYWREYREHERVAVLLLNNYVAVEEEPVTFAGYVIGKRITALRFAAAPLEAKDLELLRELPNPQDLRRLALIGEEQLKSYSPAAHQLILRSSDLEALELDSFEFSAEQIRDFAKLRRLEFLALQDAKFPAAAQTAFSEIPALKTLDLRDANIEQARFLENNLPNLEYLDLSFCKSEGTLDLTKQGFGRFPNLQYLLIGGPDVERIECEDNALAKLRCLDLSILPSDTEIPWEELQRLAPNLEALCINVHQLNAEAIPVLASWKRLRYLQYTRYGTLKNLQKIPEHSQLVLLQSPLGMSSIVQYKLEIAEELVKRCPQLQVQQRSRFTPFNAMKTLKRNFEEPFMRESQNWRARE